VRAPLLSIFSSNEGAFHCHQVQLFGYAIGKKKYADSNMYWRQPDRGSTERQSEVKTSPKRYTNIDWERVTKVLRVRAHQLYLVHDKTERMIDATTADDLVQAVIHEFLVHPSGMNWDPKQGSLETFLRTVLDRRWIDHYRRETKIAATLDDDEKSLDLPAKPENPLADLERQSFLKTIREKLNDHPDLMELIEAVEMLDDDCAQVNKELAELIRTSVSDIENRKKRLRRLLSDLRHET
jgi:RNA polymerase sigma factor (sigma-70 family)